jgi:hypothetical protein
MLEVINALGKGRDVLSVLPYTSIEFDNPIVANAETRSKILANTGKAILDISAATLPLDAAVRAVSENSDDEFKVPADVMEELKRRQVEIDRREKEKYEKEMALLDAQIALTKEQAEHVGDGPAGGAGPDKGKILTSSSGGHGYSRLDQKKHEKTRGVGARRESMQRRGGEKGS